MKRLMLVSILTLAFCPLYSLPLGNPALPTLFMDDCCDQADTWYIGYDCLQLDCFSVGYYGDFVFQRYLKNSSTSASAHQTTIYTNAGLLSLNVRDVLNVFATLGASQMNLQAFGSVVNADDASEGVWDYKRLYTLDFNDSFSWSVGARATLWECKCFGLGVEGQYFSTNPNFNSINDGGNYLVYGDNLSMRYQEWQVGLGAYYMIAFECGPLSSVVPYIGGKWSRALLDTDNAFLVSGFDVGVESTFSTSLDDFKSEKDFGFVIGTTLTFYHKLAMTVEGRFGDEKALYVTGQICF